MKEQKGRNQELRDLETHVNGAVDMQETTQRKKPVNLEAPLAPGAVDERQV